MEKDDTPFSSSRNVFLAARPDTGLRNRRPFLAVPAKTSRCYQPRILHYFFSISQPPPHALQVESKVFSEDMLGRLRINIGRSLY
jgi:hypothetical protein